MVRVHDLGEAEGLWFLTMEYVPGMTLRQVIRQHGALALRPGLQIAKQLCRGLAAVHACGIVHRDVKPQNIMVLPSGLVKLMDFGIAQTEGGRDLASQSGFLVGTPNYMSPEQTQDAVVDARSDIYAVGAVMFEMFTGRTPFIADDPLKVMQMHVSAEPPRPRAAPGPAGEPRASHPRLSGEAAGTAAGVGAGPARRAAAHPPAGGVAGHPQRSRGAGGLRRRSAASRAPRSRRDLAAGAGSSGCARTRP